MIPWVPKAVDARFDILSNLNEHGVVQRVEEVRLLHESLCWSFERGCAWF